MTYTIYVCPECGRERRERGMPCLGNATDPHPRREAVPVEVVPKSLADELAQGIERARDDEEWGDDFEAEVLAALARYREATRG